MDCKYEAILAVAFHPVKMKAIWPAALVGALSGHPRTTSKQKTSFQKSLSTSKAFFGEFSALIDVVTRHRKYATNLLGEPLRSNLCFSDFDQKYARIFSPLFDVVTGHRKYGVNLCGWTFLIFKTFSTWPRDTVNMQRIELSAFCSLPSSLCSLLAAFGHAA